MHVTAGRLVHDEIGLSEEPDVVQVEARRDPAGRICPPPLAVAVPGEPERPGVPGKGGRRSIHSQVIRVGPLVVVHRVPLQLGDGRRVAGDPAEGALRFEDVRPVREVAGRSPQRR